MGEDAVSRLEIRLLGPFDARVGSAPLPHLRTRKGQHLLAMLALRMGREVQREWLAANLWPESDPENGYYNLRRTLADLRAAIGPARDLLTAPTPHSLRLDKDDRVSVDAHRFEDLIRRNDEESLEESVALYRGPLLEGWPEEWIQTDREALQQTCLKTLDRLAAYAAEGKDWAESSRWLKRLVALEPFQEDAQRRLMEALGNNGDHAAATLVYREFRLLLHRDLNAEPAAETTALFNRLRDAARKHEKTRRRPPPATDLAPARPRLPVALTSFVGRVAERLRIKELIRKSRLLTLVGTGGCGKTRLAMQTAEELDADYEGRIAWVELSPLNREGSLWRALAAALEVREEPGLPLGETVCRALAGEPRLIVLDNCEHLLDPSGQMASEILQRCSRVRVLATSREPLTITGEVTFRVPSMAVPEWTVAGKPDVPALLEYESVRLFAERAAQVEPRFGIDEENATAVSRVCRQLDGIPLAIELAASRVGSMTTDQIALRLDDRFRLLKWPRRDIMPRHRTLRALVDWSYDLLTESERALFRRLSVFAGGWTPEAAESVCADTSEGEGSDSSVIAHPSSFIESWEILELLTRLVDKSLVVFDGEERPSAGRYRMLETMRQYAGERLKEAEEERALRDRHAQYHLALAEATEPDLTGPGIAATAATRLVQEEANLFSALTWLTDSDGARGDDPVRMVAALGRYWFIRGRIQEGREWCERVLFENRRVTEHRAAALNWAGQFARYQGDYQRAISAHDEAISIGRDLKNQRIILIGQNSLGQVAYRKEDFSNAIRLHTSCLELARELDDDRGVLHALINLGLSSTALGDYPAADAYFSEGMKFRQREDFGGVWLETKWAAAKLAQALYSEAEEYYAEAIRLFGGLNDPFGVSFCLDGFARILASRSAASSDSKAARLFGAAQAARESAHGTIASAEWKPVEECARAVKGRLGAESFDLAWAEGCAYSLDEAVRLALGKLG